MSQLFWIKRFLIINWLHISCYKLTLSVYHSVSNPIHMYGIESTFLMHFSISSIPKTLMEKEFFESGSTKNSGRYWCKQAKRRLLPDSINVLGCSCMDNRRESIKRYVFLNMRYGQWRRIFKRDTRECVGIFWFALFETRETPTGKKRSSAVGAS